MVVEEQAQLGRLGRGLALVRVALEEPPARRRRHPRRLVEPAVEHDRAAGEPGLQDVIFRRRRRGEGEGGGEDTPDRKEARQETSPSSANRSGAGAQAVIVGRGEVRSEAQKG